MIILLLIIIIGLYFILSSNSNPQQQNTKKPTNTEVESPIPQKRPEKPSTLTPKPKAYTEPRIDPNTDPEQTKQKLALKNDGEYIIRHGIDEEPSVFPKSSAHPTTSPQPIEAQHVSILSRIRDLSFNQKIIELTSFYEKELFRAKYKDAIRYYKKFLKLKQFSEDAVFATNRIIELRKKCTSHNNHLKVYTRN